MAGVLPESMNLNTLATITTPISSNKGLPTLQEWAYDFERNELATNDAGLPYLVQGNEALKIWIYWAIATERFKYNANSPNYGSEINTMIGLPATQAIKSSELERTIRESLEQCPYITRVSSLDIRVEDDIVVADVNVQSKYKEGWVHTIVKV